MANAVMERVRERVRGRSKPRSPARPPGEPTRRLPRLGPGLVTLVLAIAVLATYAAFALQGVAGAGSTVGIAFGIGAAVMLLAVMLYSVRRALPAVRRFGRTQPYLQLHLYAGALFGLLFLVHTGFDPPPGAFTALLWWVSLWVLLTGAVGVLLQRVLPRMLGVGTSVEIHLQRTRELLHAAREQARESAASAGPRVQEFYQRHVAPDLEGPRPILASLTGGREAPSPRAYEILERTLTAEQAEALGEVRRLHRAKRDMDVHYALQRVLRTWLVLHLPPAIVLLGLVALHIFFVLYF